MPINISHKALCVNMTVLEKGGCCHDKKSQTEKASGQERR